MKYIRTFLSLFVAVTLLSRTSECSDITRFPLLMPNVKPNMPELYLCTPVKIRRGNYYIVGFEPNATMNTAHHMLVYGCSKPGSSKSVWNCGEMAQNTVDDREYAGPCSEQSEIIYAWARDAPILNLPNGVGFKVGDDSPIKYLVLQVHYAHIHKFKDGITTDNSGIFLKFTKEEKKKLAGVMTMGTDGIIEPYSTTYMETACKLKENQEIIPFAYRTHTHSLGRVVSGYVIKDNRWIELGKRDPLTPQMFYPVTNNVTIGKDDILAARCTMVSNRSHVTRIGSTNNDEMCNFYIMYYVEQGKPLEQKYCFTQGPPAFDWQVADLENIPLDASTL